MVKISSNENVLSVPNQCDQMAWLFLNYMNFFNTEIDPIVYIICKKMAKNFDKY